jgi:hypothetical protein
VLIFVSRAFGTAALPAPPIAAGSAANCRTLNWAVAQDRLRFGSFFLYTGGNIPNMPGRIDYATDPIAPELIYRWHENLRTR